jgi:hypothetical protein
MKLEIKGYSIMMLASIFMLIGCKKQTGLEILSTKMDGMKSLKTEYIVRQSGQKDVSVSFIYTKPNRMLFTSSDFVVALNEVDGHFESKFSDKVYDQMPWDGRVFPGTRNLVPDPIITAGPFSGASPSVIAKGTPWKLEGKTGNVERYSKTVQSQEGPQTYKLEVNENGEPVSYVGTDETTYVAKSFQVVDELPLQQFRVEPKLGFLAYELPADLLMLQTGAKFDWSKFQAASDVRSFKPDGNTLFIFVDPSEPSSRNAMTWISSAGSGYKKVTITKGSSQTGFFDPSGEEIRKITSSTPLFVMVNKDLKIVGMWLGFDLAKTKQFEADIQLALSK